MDKKSSSMNIFNRHGWCHFYLGFYTVGVSFCTVGVGFLLNDLHGWCYGATV